MTRDCHSSRRLNSGCRERRQCLDYLMAQPGMVDYINSASGWAIVGPS